MKKICLLLICIPFLYSYSQSYQPLLNQNNEWQFTNCNFGCITDFYFTDGDTLVNGKMQKILDGFHFISRSFLLFEDLQQRQVYLSKINKNQIDEYLLYDFSLKVGDSITMLNPISPFPQNGGYFILDSIVLLPLVDKNNYRHFYFTPTPSNPFSTQAAIWIEGVGSLSTVNAPGGHPDINNVGHLSCFFKNNTLFYSNLDSIKGCFPMHLGINEYQKVRKLSLEKTPIKNQFLLKHILNNPTIFIYDLSGKLIKTLKTYGENEKIINLTEFKRNMYFIVVNDSAFKKTTFKVIIL